MPKRVAFLIGNQTFGSDSGFPPLQGPANDIAALVRLLRDPERGNFEVREFLDKTHYEILPDINQALGSAALGDLFLIYYSGHGKTARNGHLCLATANTRRDALRATSIPARDLRDIVEESDCDQVVLLLDCCYSGAVDDGLRGDVDGELNVVDDAHGFYIMTASTSTQSAREMASSPDGVVMGRFTATLVNGIENGAADQDHKGKILLSDLRHYLGRVAIGSTPLFFARKASGDPLISFSPATAGPLLDLGPKDNLPQRITETFYKAVEQLGSEKVAARIGGISMLERLAQEALRIPEQSAGSGLYLSVIETLTAFVRENAKWPEETATPALPQSQTGSRAAAALAELKPATDIAAALDVIGRRPETGRIREIEHGFRFDLRATDLRGADLSWSDLNRADLARANLSNAELAGVKLREANLWETDLSGANLNNDEVLKKAHAMATLTAGVGHLTFAYLMKENWAETLLQSPFHSAFPRADRRALIEGSYHRWTDLMADLSEASLVGADLRGAKLGGACLSKADLREANLSNATLTAANLRGADLRWADLSGADLSGADLSGAYLCDAKLAGAKLKMVELSDANITGAHFEGADLTEVPLDGISLIVAYGDANTRLPRGVTRPAHWPPETPDRF